MKRYDLHIHTCYSPCSCNKPEDILKAAKKTGLNGIAITDHNTCRGAFKTKKLNRDKDFDVIIGEEIKTDKGEIIALYLQKEIKPNTLFNVIDEIRSQDAISVIAHPSRWAPWQRFRYPLKDLVGKVNAVEVFNSRNIGWANSQSKKMVKNLDFAAIGSSDAHILLDIGKARTLFEGSLREAVKKRQTKAEGTTRYAMLSALISVINGRILSPLGVKRKWA